MRRFGKTGLYAADQIERIADRIEQSEKLWYAIVLLLGFASFFGAYALMAWWRAQ